MPFRFTNQEYAQMHFVYGFCDGNALQAVQEYRRRFPNRRLPHRRVFENVHNLFVTHGLKFAPRHPNHRNANQVRRNNRVLLEFNRDPRTSQRRVSRLTAISKTTIQRVLKQDHRRPFHLQPVQGLHPGDEERRMVFCRWLLDSIQNDDHFLNNVLWTDESCFT